MDSVFTSWWFVLFFWFLCILSIEFTTHQTRDYQVKEIVEYAVQEIQNHGGYTDAVAEKITNRMNHLGLSSAGFQIEAPKNRIDFEEEFSVRIKGDYTYRAFNILGSELGNMTVPLSSSGVGIGQVYFR